MGGMKILKDGHDFHDDPDSFPESFGFHGKSTAHTRGPKMGASPKDKFSRGGKMMHEHERRRHGEPEHHAKGGAHHKHPHGHEVTHVEHGDDGTVIMHHAHGGMTCHYADGGVTHHDDTGATVSGFMQEPHSETHDMGHDDEVNIADTGHVGMTSMAHPHGHEVVHVESHGDGEIHHHAHGGFTHHHDDGRVTHHDDSGHMCHGGRYAMGGPTMVPSRPIMPAMRRARGGDIEQDKAMVKKAMRQHEDHEHHGEHTDLHLRRGGPSMVPHRASLPASPPTMRPETQVSPRNVSPTGNLGYGIEPSSETPPDGMRRGGRHRMKR